jgi:hypothetical protein
MPTIPRFDAHGYAVPWADDDAVIECGALDPEHGEPEAWPAWTDEDRYELGPASGDDDYRPSAEDPTYEPTPEDLAKLEQWLDRLDTLQCLAEYPGELQAAAGPLSDEGITTAGLAVG